MRFPSHSRELILLLSSFLLFSCLGVSPAAAQETRSFKNLILISVDGLNYEGYSAYDKTNLKYLAADGASTDSCLAVQADTIEAGEASILTGSLPEEHLHYTRTDKVQAESLLDVIYKSGRSVLVVDGSGGKLQVFSRGPKEYVKIDSQQSDSYVMNTATELFLDRKPFFTFIYLDDCRTFSLLAGSKDYYRNLKTMDTEIGKLVKVLKDRDIYEETALIVTASHGSSAKDMVPLILKAPGIKTNSRLQGVSIIDLAPTICALAGLDRPYNSSGVIIWDAFLPGEEVKAEALVRQQMQELQQERIRVWKRLYQSNNERDRFSRQIEEIKEEQQSIFSYAGEKERTIGELRRILALGKGMMAGMTVIFLAGYLVEYRWLKRRFMLFK